MHFKAFWNFRDPVYSPIELWLAPPLQLPNVDAEAEPRCITDDKIESCWGLFTDFSGCLALSLFLSFAICSISYSHFSQRQWIHIKMIALFPRENSGLRSTEKYIHYNNQPSAVTFNTKYIRTREPGARACCFIYFVIPEGDTYFCRASRVTDRC